jgi:hypothetical protein
MTAGLRTVVASLVGETGSETDSSPETERRGLASHARPWALGGRVLRAETAVLAGLSAIHVTRGGFRNAG